MNTCTKCGRERPECDQCRTRGTNCIYETLPGETRGAALRAKSGRIQNDLNTMVELFWFVSSEAILSTYLELTFRRHLRTQPKGDAALLLQSIQSGVEPYEILRDFRLGSQSRSGSLSSGTTQSTPITSHPESSNDAVSMHASSIPCELLDPINIIAALEQGVDAFFNCTGSIFYIYEQSEAQNSLAIVREHIKSMGPRSFQSLLRDSVYQYQKAAMCSVCIIAAVGLQYTRDAIPAMGFAPSRQSGTFCYVNFFLEMTKTLMDAVIEINILEAIKVCAASCVYNTILHATVALAYAGTHQVILE